MIWRALLVAAVLVGGCTASQPASLRQVEAIEVDVAQPADRATLIAILSDRARRDGLHLDDVSEEWVGLGRDDVVTSPARKSIYIGLWRTEEDKDLLVSVDDGGHLGKPWIVFLQGEKPELSAKLRISLLRDIRREWPDARSVPIMPNGALPLYADLIWTGSTYAVKADRIPSYAARTR